MKKLYSILVILIAAVAIWGTGDLVKNEFELGDICPKIIGIPACYIVYLCFIVALVSHVFTFRFNTKIYFIFVGLVTSIALFGTMGEVFGFAKCPPSSFGIPMCFISLSICVSLLVTKVLYTRSK